MVFVVSLINISTRLLDRFNSSMYVAAFPIIIISLQISQQETQLSMVFYTVGLLISYIVFSAAAQYYQERSVLLTGLVICLLSTIFITFSGNAIELIIGRFFQALGVGCAPVIANGFLSRHIVSDSDDFKDNRKAIVLLSYLSAIFTWFPALAMLTGGIVAHHFGWHAIFFTLSLLNLSILILLYFIFPKRSPGDASEPNHSIKSLIKQYQTLCKNRQFIVYSLMLSLMISGIAAYYLISPFVYHHKYDLTVIKIGYLSIFQILGYLFGKLLSVALVKASRFNTLKLLGIFFVVLGSVFMMVLDGYLLHYLALLIPIVIFSIGVGFLSPYVNIMVMRAIHNFAIGADGLFSVIIFLVSAIATFILTYFLATQSLLGIYFVIVSLLISLIYFISGHKISRV